MAVHLKRAYEPASASDGKRYLVDRLWPRGVKRDNLRLDGWLKELAPSTELRRWFGHEPGRWDEFRLRYQEELRRPEASGLIARLAREAQTGTVTLVFAAKDVRHNDAVVLKETIEAVARA
jgi:uncharacterized protein YeaO (DUF488 family)